jgi:hypothetical protein
MASLGAIVLGLLVVAAPALAGPPAHSPLPAEIGGLNHACGVAVDSEGDVYASSAGESLIKIFSPSHAALGSIANPNVPCAVAVNGKGEVFVSEAANGWVVRYKPSAYPFVGVPVYGSREPIDESGKAKGIAVDPSDGRLYVAEGDRVAVYKADGSFEANVAEGELSAATGVAAYTSASGLLYLSVAENSTTDRIALFGGSDLGSLSPRGEILGPKAGEDFGFGPGGAYLAVDSGNRSGDGKCTEKDGGQACTSGHLLVYDAAHNAIDEFDAAGEFLDAFTSPALADAQPTAMAVDRSTGENDGTIYVSSGAAAAAKLLAFGPLAAPSRVLRGELAAKLNAGEQLKSAAAVATDSRGDVYVATGALIRVFDSSGSEILVGPGGNGIPVPAAVTPVVDLAVDSTGKVYVLDHAGDVTYYTPTAYPPVDGASYSRHEPPIFSKPPECVSPNGIAVNPRNDHVFVVTRVCPTVELDSAAPGHDSKVLDPCFACSFVLGVNNEKLSIGVYGANGNVYIGARESLVYVLDKEGKEILAEFDGSGCPSGKFDVNPHIAVDQSNGHVIVNARDATIREYDASGACVTEFGNFTTSIVVPYRVAIDNACALHDPPLTETTTPTCSEFAPSDGTAYAALDETAKGSFDLWPFAPVSYADPPVASTGTASEVDSGKATLNGTVNPGGVDLTDCYFDYTTEADFKLNTFSGPDTKAAACIPDVAGIGKGKVPVPVHADLSGLVPGERYYFRLVAANKFGTEFGDTGLFGPPVVAVDSERALPVLYTEATLRASIESSGLPSEYHFEYGTDPGIYEQSTPVVDLAPGATPVDVEATIAGLGEGTAYHFRVVVENEAGETPGLDEEFKTLERPASADCPNTEFRFGLSAKLPDCRAYELVTPAETNGFDPVAYAPGGERIASFNNWLVTPRGEGAGERVSYFTTGTLPGFDGNGLVDGYRAQRGAGSHPTEGWTSALVGPGFTQAAPDFSHPPNQRSVAADQHYAFWLIQPAKPTPGALPTGTYLRTPDVTAKTRCSTEPLSSFELVGCGSLGTDPGAKNRYLSLGGTHVIFLSDDHLEDDAAPKDTMALYDRPAGSDVAEVISMKPDDGVPGSDPFGADEDADYVAASEDGAAIVFKVGGTLYLHRGGQTTDITSGPHTFAGISTDGKRVFYTATASESAPAAIYVCDLDAGPCNGAGKHEISASALFVNVSPDGSSAFFTEGNELYAWDAATGTENHIGTLDSDDFVSFDGETAMNLSLWTRSIGSSLLIGRAASPTRSTPDGDVFVFQSHAQLTAYDNEGHGEIYRYEPAAPPGEQLLCVSCDPAEAPPSADAMLVDMQSGVDRSTVVANVTDDGQRVFFESPDQLLPEDANSAKDVYEWTAKGTESCSAGSGCLALISSGQGDTDSYLYGMSADGNDVFFRTQEKLVGLDIPGSPSIYDARVGGGIPEPPVPAPCQGDACQGNGSTPPVLPTVASGGSGGGDVTQSGSKKACGKGKHRVKGRCVKKHQKRKHSQANHKGRAHR